MTVLAEVMYALRVVRNGLSIRMPLPPRYDTASRRS